MNIDIFNVVVVAKHNDVFLAFTTIYQNLTAEESSNYIGQVFNAMIHSGLITKSSEKLICLTMFVQTNTTNFIVVARNKNDALTINSTNISNLINQVKNYPIGTDIYSFTVDTDLSKPILFKSINYKTLGKGINELFSEESINETNKNSIKYIVTIKPN